jgi:hypothetical protein
MDNLKKLVAHSVISAVQYGVLQKVRELSYEASIVSIDTLEVLIRVRDQPIAGVQDPGPRYFRIKVSEQL